MAVQNFSEQVYKIKILLTDCDGVLTDGKIYYSSEGVEIKAFHARDGKGLKLLLERGIICGIITGRKSEMVNRRARELGIQEVYQDAGDKEKIFDEIIERYDVFPEETAYIGDDINDLPVLKRVGFSAAVADAVREVKQKVDYVTQRKGGSGALREVVDFLVRYNLLSEIN